MKNYIKKILVSGLISGTLAFNAGCQDERNPKANLDTYTMEDTGYGNDTEHIDSFFDTGIGYDTGDTGVEDTGIGYDTGDTSVEDTGIGYDTGDTGIEDTGIGYDTGDTGVEDTGIGYDTGDTGVEDTGIETCLDLSLTPTCLSEDYTTLLSNGTEMNEALNLGYENPTLDVADLETKNIVSGNPCALSGYFTGESCVDWLSSYVPGTSTIQLIDENTVEVQGDSLERIAALTLLMDGDAQGTECIVTGDDPSSATIYCNN